KRHRAQLDLTHGFVQVSFLLGWRKIADLRKIEVLAAFADVLCGDPIRGADAVEPRKTRLVGVTVVTGGAKDLFHVGRRLEVGGYWRIRETRAEKWKDQKCNGPGRRDPKEGLESKSRTSHETSPGPPSN